MALFVDRAAEAGLDFVHFNGMSGERYFVEIMGAGAALFDYDNDGDLDVYLVQGGMLGPDKTFDDAIFPPRHPLPLTDRLYRNDLKILPAGERELRFVDVTDGAASSAGDYGMGVAAGDFDNDGWVDLYVTNFGANRLLRNNGDGTFSDVTGRDRHRRPALERSRLVRRLSTATAGSTSTSATTSTSAFDDPPVLPAPPARATTAGRSPTGPSRTACSATGATARSRTSPPGGGVAGRSGRRPGRRRGRLRRRRRLGHLRRQRQMPNQLWINAARRHASRTTRSSPAAPSTGRASPRRAWGSTPPTSTATATRTSS